MMAWAGWSDGTDYGCSTIQPTPDYVWCDGLKKVWLSHEYKPATVAKIATVILTTGGEHVRFD
ncbi:MAG: hypothetical protein IK122_00445 [Alphaproteobacteria bacterium]|nr:hypothetical protein [Alphaproteobacteria bacterium]